jgi:hypothetical protein
MRKPVDWTYPINAPSGAKALLRSVPDHFSTTMPSSSGAIRVHGAPGFWKLLAGVHRPTGDNTMTRLDRRHLLMGLGAALNSRPVARRPRTAGGRRAAVRQFLRRLAEAEQNGKVTKPT